MGKRQIRIREAIADVRAGMSDTALMEKYQLAAKGLQSLLTKLVASQLITLKELERRMPEFMQSASINENLAGEDNEAWKIRRTKPGEGTGQTVTAADAVRNIKAGMTDSELMERYRLSSKGLQDLFEKLVKAKLVTSEEIDRRMPTMDRTVDLRGMLDDLKLDELDNAFDEDTPAWWTCPSCGVSKDQEFEVCPKCGHETSKQVDAGGRPDAEKGTAPAPEPPKQSPLKSAPPQLAPETQKNAQPEFQQSVNTDQILEGVRAGLTDSELMDKHNITYAKLDEIFQQLLDAQAVTRGELYGRSSLFLDTVSVDATPEESTHYLAFPIPVSDARDPRIVGRLRNVKERMVGMVGIEAKIDEKRSFVVYPEKFVDVQPIAFDATCVWFVKESEGYYAGFQITYISDRDQYRLDELVRALTLGY